MYGTPPCTHAEQADSRANATRLRWMLCVHYGFSQFSMACVQMCCQQFGHARCVGQPMIHDAVISMGMIHIHTHTHVGRVRRPAVLPHVLLAFAFHKSAA